MREWFRRERHPRRAQSTTERPWWVRAGGVTVLVASFSLVVGALLEVAVPVPDSFVFRPPVTHPQFVRSVVLPVLWLLAALGFLVGLVTLWLRDRRAYDSLRHLLAGGAGLGVAFVALAYLGFAVTSLNELTGGGDELTSIVSAFVFLAGGALAVVGLVFYGIVLAVRGPARRVGIALGAGILVGTVASTLWVGGLLLFTTGFVVLGVALLVDPEPWQLQRGEASDSELAGTTDDE